MARRAATLLREQFEAKRVAGFGSLVYKGCFTPWSDVDIAAWGILPQDTFRATVTFSIRRIEPLAHRLRPSFEQIHIELLAFANFLDQLVQEA